MDVHERAKSSYLRFNNALRDNRLLEYKWFLEQEVDTWDEWVELPLSRRLWLWRRGFTSPNERLYDLDRYGPSAYLSELQRYRLYKSANDGHRYHLDDKLSQHWMLADSPKHRPTAFGFVDRGFVHGAAGTGLDGPVSVAEWLPSTLRREGKLVLKELRGQGGDEVLVCEYDDGYMLDGRPLSERELCDEIAELSGYLVTEHVDQHGYADDLYPHATNTVRILTVWDDQAEELFVPIAIQRIGTEESRPVDNCSAGGLTAEIDLGTGEIGPATRLHTEGEPPWYDTHPDTGAVIAGASVPDWETVRSTVEDIARDNTHIPIIGWDLLLDESGDPIVIEANTGPDIDLLQVHRPLLADPRFRRVAARHLTEVDAPATRDDLGSRSASTVEPLDEAPAQR